MRHLVLGAIVLAAACAEAPSAVTPQTGPSPVLPDEPVVPAPVSATQDPAPPSGPALWIEARVDDIVAIEVWGRELGPVAGFAFTMAFDPAQVEVEDPELDEVLGAEGRGMLRRFDDQLVAGAVRVGDTPTDLTLDAPVRLLSASVRPRADGHSRLRLLRPEVRSADGSAVGVATAGVDVDVRGAR